MNQDNLKVVKHETARVNLDILGVSDFKWKGMDKLNSDENYIFYSGQKYLKRTGVALRVKKQNKTTTTKRIQMPCLTAISQMRE